MALIADYLFDLALSELNTAGNELHITSSEATTYTQAITTFSLGTKTSLSIGPPADGTVSGRKVDVATFSDGVVDTGGTAAFWAVVDTVAGELMSTGALAAPVVVSTPGTFSLTAFEIDIRDAT
jgi:hypothetical protein